MSEIKIELNLQDLKKATKEAIDNGKRLKEQKDALEKEKQAIAKEEAKSKAHTLIATIPNRARIAAMEGKNHLVIMELEDSDYERPFGSNWNVVDPSCLKDKVKLIYEWCVASGLKPTIDNDHDGVGFRSWFNLTIHW